VRAICPRARGKPHAGAMPSRRPGAVRHDGPVMKGVDGRSSGRFDPYMRDDAVSLGRVRGTTGRSLAVVLFLIGLVLTAGAQPALAYTCQVANHAASVTLTSDDDDPPIVLRGTNGQLIVG